MEFNIKKPLLAKFLVIFLLISAIFLHFFLNKTVSNHLVINEVVFSSEEGVDWIEIYNPTMNNLSLKGLYLSDKSDDPSRFKIDEDLMIPTHSFAVIYCDGYKDEGSEVVTNFRISNGETVYLVAKDGSTIIDSMTVLGEDGDENFSIGRFPDGSDDVFIFSETTSGTYNKKDIPDNIRQKYE